MSTLDEIEKARESVSTAQTNLELARIVVHDANAHLMRAMSPIFDLVMTVQPITCRPPSGEIVEKVKIGRRFIRCRYPSDNGLPIRIPVALLDMPTSEAAEIIIADHLRRRKIEADRIAEGLSKMSSDLHRMSTPD